VLEAVARGDDPLPVYEDAVFSRRSSYMATETGQRRDLALMGGHVEGGYARAALGVIEAMQQPTGREIIVNTLNGGAIADLDAGDVVEVPCGFAAHGPRARKMGALPPQVRDLTLRVKEYERATVRAALDRSWSAAVAALAAHPLVPSRKTAEQIAGEYRREHSPHLDYLV
jgi:6-phospho-beta-glucosidase